MNHALLAAFVIGFGGVACAQPEGDPLPTLDELLGLESDDASNQDAVEQELESELDQNDAISDAFLEAVGLMSQSADRLGGSGGTGVVTQRIQEDILKKLEQLINDAQQGSSSSSSSSGSQSQNQQQSQPQPRQGQQEQQGESQPGEGDPDQFGDGPAGQAAQPGTASMNAAAWGSLPARLRDALLQGSAEGYSSMYRSLTEEYYRRLAEEASE